MYTRLKITQADSYGSKCPTSVDKNLEFSHQKILRVGRPAKGVTYKALSMGWPKSSNIKWPKIGTKGFTQCTHAIDMALKQTHSWHGTEKG